MRLIRGLAAAIETPLGPLVGDLRLRDLDRRDRLDELAFEIPLVGGDAPSGELTVGAIGALLRAHLPADDVLAGYAGRLDDLSPQSSLRGYLSGSIDLVLRTEQPGGPGRFAVVDYKTNWLGSEGRSPLRLELPAGGPRRGDATGPLPAAVPALYRRPAPVPALAPPRLRPRAEPRRRLVPLRAGNESARPRPESTDNRAGSSPGPHRSGWLRP